MANPTILIIEDDNGIRDQLKWALSDGYRVIISEDGSDVLTIIQDKRPDLILLDLHLPPHTETPDKGLNILSTLMERDGEIKVIVISGNNHNKVILRAIDMGAYDYLSKPFNFDELQVLVRRALYVQRLEQENKRLREQLTKKYSFQNIIGSSPQMNRIFSIINRVAYTDATILLTGENGTGKELIAKAIHYHSPRSKEPFQVIDCGAIPHHLLESELFGHEKGSFTGAYERKIGKVELAHKGTLFLDEIGELDLSLQVKLLRFLQEREIERVGGTNRIKVDVRVITATNKDLKEALRDGSFREDLFFRLNVISIEMPPLRRRGGDILLLAQHFLEQMAKEKGRKIKGFSKSAQEALNRYSWPGNVRELKNTIERAVILSSGNLISEKDLGLDNIQESCLLPLKDAKIKLEKQYVTEALERTGGNVTRAASLIGVNRRMLTRLMQRYGIGNKRPLKRGRFLKIGDFQIEFKEGVINWNNQKFSL